MTDMRAFKALSLLATIGVLVAAACTIQLRGGEEASRSPNGELARSAAGVDLARCRSVTAEETAAYRHCQQVWAENRRHFLGKKSDPADLGRDDSAPGLASVPKDQSRIPQGYPQPSTLEASKP